MKHIIKYSFIFFILFISCSNSGNNTQIKEQSKITPGIYNMEEYLKNIQSKKVGIVANLASVIENTNLIDTLLESGINITKIFAPEHGFMGKVEAGGKVSDQSYSNKNIPIISLYGKSKKPLPATLSDIDVMIFDLQDVGVRFYTYISTLHYLMEACAEENIPLIILDRPNPNGFYIDGPVLEHKYRSFIGMHPVPVVYGMTIGEYALMINGEKWLKNSVKCNITIIKCKNYTHNSFYDITVKPSPNLGDMRAIYLYPSIAFFEGTVVSEGRGTDFPFVVTGHPDYSLQNFSFTPAPKPGASLSPKFNGKKCYGLDLRDLPLDSLRKMKQLELSFLLDFYADLNLGERFFIPFFDQLAGTDKLRKMIIANKSEDEIRESWKSEINEFKKIRAKYLLYPDFE